MRVEPRHTAGLDAVGARGTAATLTVRARAAARLAAPVTLAGTAAALALLAWTAIAPESAAGAAFVPLLVGMVFLGLPHGALDHLVPARMGVAWGRRPSTLALFLAGYVGLAGAFLWLWTAAPALAFGGFLVATVWHWGQGDVDFLERFLGRRRGGRIDHAAAVVLRGALPVAVPVLVQTEVAEGLFATAAVATGAVAVGGLGLGAPAVGWGLGGALLALAGVYLAGLGRAWRGWPGRALDVGELLLLVSRGTRSATSRACCCCATSTPVRSPPVICAARSCGSRGTWLRSRCSPWRFSRRSPPGRVRASVAWRGSWPSTWCGSAR